MAPFQRRVTVIGAGMLLFAASCSIESSNPADPDSATDPGSHSGIAQLVVHLTDAPSAMLDTAEVEIGAVMLVPADGPPITLTEEAGIFDLLTLQDGVTALLADSEIEPGRYHQLRMVVTAARVVLAEGHTFSDGSTERELKVPSGARSGLKINLHCGCDGEGDGDGGVEIAPGLTNVVIDFDVAQNFLAQGNPNTPAGLKGILFKPLLRAVVMDDAGSISGTLTPDGEVSVEGLTVRAERVVPDGAEVGESETPIATAVSDVNGAYTIRFLAPGTYTVTVDDVSTTPESIEVHVEPEQDVTGVDFTINA